MTQVSGGAAGRAREAGSRKVGIRLGPGAAVQQAAAGEQDQAVKVLADVAARLVDGAHDLRTRARTQYGSLRLQDLL